MKQLIKVFTIIGMVCGFWMIFPIVIGIISLKKLDEAETKDDLTTWGVLNLIFCSLIGGILMLCISEDEL